MDQNTIDMATTAAPTTQCPTQWSREDEKSFERAFLTVPENSPNRWEEIAEKVPGKSAAEVRDYYQYLVHYISEVESGRVELPIYPDDLVKSGGRGSSDSESGASGSPDSKKGILTKEEQRLLLAELEKYEKEGCMDKQLFKFSWDKNTHK